MERTVDLRLPGDALEGTGMARGKAIPVKGWRYPVISDRDHGRGRMGDFIPLLTANLDRRAEYPSWDNNGKLPMALTPT